MGAVNAVSEDEKKPVGSLELTCPSDETLKQFKLQRRIVAFFIGGAGDKESYYGFGPKNNVDYARTPFTTSVNLAEYAAGCTSFHLGYNQVIGEDNIKANVLGNLKCKSDAVYIVGHSLGGWNGAHLSSILTDMGYSVKVLVTLDPVGNGAMVGAISNIYPETPKPKAGLWINVFAAPDKTNFSDFIAGMGEQWRLEDGPNVNSKMDVNHEEADVMFTTVLADEKSALAYVIQSINKHFRG